jgi:hypothetical protein
MQNEKTQEVTIHQQQMMIGNQQSAQLMQCMASQDEFDCF